MEGGLDAQVIYDPPNLTYPYGAYIAVVDIDPDTAQVTVRRFIAVDDCGVRINPMVVDGQIHGGLAEGIGIALMEVITFDEEGNCLNSSFMDYLIPTALECPTSSSARRSRPARTTRSGRRASASRRTSGRRRRSSTRSSTRCTTPRRRPHRHALHPGPRLGGDAGAARAAAMISGDCRGGRGGSGGGHGVRDRDGRPRAAPDEREGGPRRARAADGTIEGFVGGVVASRACVPTR